MHLPEAIYQLTERSAEAELFEDGGAEGGDEAANL